MNLLGIHGDGKIKAGVIFDAYITKLAGVEHVPQPFFGRDLIIFNDTADAMVYFGEFPGRDQVYDIELRSAFENPVGFVDGFLLVGEVRKGRESHRHIEGRVGEGQANSIGIDDIDVGEGEVPVGFLGHFIGEIDTGHGSLVAYFSAQYVEENAGSAAEVEQRNSFVNP